MSKKDIILLVVIIALVGASGVLLYRSFNEDPASVIPNPTSVNDEAISNQADRIEFRIKKAIKKLEEGGELGVLEKDPQFMSLNEDSIKPIVIGKSGRSNPFLSVQR